MSRHSRAANTAPGFTKPPILGVRVTVPRSVLSALVGLAWISATLGRLHPVAVAALPVVMVIVAFTTIYHVPTTHWVMTGWAWLRRRRVTTPAPVTPAEEVFVSGVAIGVVSEHEVLSVMIELHSDPMAPTVATDTEERTANVLDVAELAYTALQVLDVDVASVDLISDGRRAAGGFADLYQQLTGPTIAPADRRSWIVARIRLDDNMGAIDRRGSDAQSPQRVAAATCLRVADALASSGIDARPATAATIDSVNARLHAEEPSTDHWSYLESTNSYTGVYYADPGHIGVDSPQWWTWPLSRDVTALIRITPGTNGNRPRIGALVRYRTDARTPAPPVSRLGPLYGVQALMWQQFRVGYLPCDTPPPTTALPAEGPVVPFGPAGPLIGAIGDPRDHTAVHLPLVSPITVLCQNSLLLRQVTLRSCVTGRPVVVVTDEPDKWEDIVPMAVAGAILTEYPDDWDNLDTDTDTDTDAVAGENVGERSLLDPDTILVLDTDKEWPEHLPPLTILTADGACDADIELAANDEEYGFTLKFRTGLRAQVRAMPAHEERRILGLGAPPSARRGATTPQRPAADRHLARTAGNGASTPAAKAPRSAPPPAGRVTPAPQRPQHPQRPQRPVKPPTPSPQSSGLARHAADGQRAGRSPRNGTPATGGIAPRPTRPTPANPAPPRATPPAAPPRPSGPAPTNAPAPRSAAPPLSRGQAAPPARPATPTPQPPTPAARPAPPAPQAAQGGQNAAPAVPTPPQRPAQPTPVPGPAQSAPPAPTAPAPRPAASPAQPAPSTPASRPAAPVNSAPPRQESRPPTPVPPPPAAERERHDWAAVAGRGRRGQQGDDGKHPGSNSDESQRSGLLKRWRGRQLKATTSEPEVILPPHTAPESPPHRVVFTRNRDDEGK